MDVVVRWAPFIAPCSAPAVDHREACCHDVDRSGSPSLDDAPPLVARGTRHPEPRASAGVLDGEAAGVEHHPQGEERAIGALVLGVPAPRLRLPAGCALPQVRGHRRRDQEAQRALEAVEQREDDDRAGRESEPHAPLQRSGDEHRRPHCGDHPDSDPRADAGQQLSVHGDVSATSCAVPGRWGSAALAPRPDSRRAGSGRPDPLPARVRARSVR